MQTFTAREVDVFRKETELLVVSQVACLVLGDISWFVSDFPTLDQVLVRAHTVSKLKLMANLSVYGNVVLSVVESVLMCLILHIVTHLTTKPSLYLKV